MAYDLGEAGISDFGRMLAHLEAGDYVEASNEMLRSLWSKQVPTRATDDAKLMLEG